MASCILAATVAKQVVLQRHVVIIGGGYAGCELGTILLSWGVPFTLIDPKEYFHLTMGALRATVDPGKSYIYIYIYIYIYTLDVYFSSIKTCSLIFLKAT